MESSIGIKEITRIRENLENRLIQLRDILREADDDLGGEEEEEQEEVKEEPITVLDSALVSPAASSETKEAEKPKLRFAEDIMTAAPVKPQSKSKKKRKNRHKK